MELLNIAATYVFIGTVFTFCVDVINNYLKANKDRINWDPPKDEDWGTPERLIAIAIWPIAAYIFISAFLKARRK